MSLSLRLKKSIILLLASAVVGVLLLVGSSTIRSLQEIKSLWRAHSHEATLHISEIDEIRHHFGYGGFIHHFKNYILRQNEEYRARSEESLVHLMQAIGKAEKLHLSPLERLALGDVRRTAEAYHEKYLLARAMVDAGKLPREIDKAVMVDEHGAIEAFRLLSELAIQREKWAEADADRRIRKAVGVTLWGAVLIPLVLMVAFLLWRFLSQIVQTNDTLERVRKELDAILANAPDAMLTVMDDGSIARSNDQAEQLFGYSGEQLRRMHIEELIPESFHSGDKVLRPVFMSEEDEGKLASGRLLTAVTRDAREIPVEIGLSVLRQEGAVRAVATIRDVTERLRAQRKIEDLNASLQAQNKELESFSYSVSHDLRTPLRSIEGFSQLVEKRYAQKLDETGVDYLQRIRRATVRMGQLIDDLLQLSRVSRAEIKPRYLDMSAMAAEILHGLSESEPERLVKWHIEPEIYCVADPGLLRVVLENLLGNAWKYSSTREPAHIHLGCRKDGDEVVYFVRDNGVGFDMRYADKLFGAFQRLHGIDEFEGTGIGLSTVQRIVHRHGGKVWAEAEPDRGASFYFTLGRVDERVINV